MKEIGIGIIGLGIVGSGVYETLVRQSDEIARRTGVKLTVRKAADLDESRRRQLGISAVRVAHWYGERRWYPEGQPRRLEGDVQERSVVTIRLPSLNRADCDSN